MPKIIGTTPSSPESTRSVRVIAPTISSETNLDYWVLAIREEIDTLKSSGLHPREIFVGKLIWMGIMKEFMETQSIDKVKSEGDPTIWGVPVTVRPEIDYVVVVGVERRSS